MLVLHIVAQKEKFLGLFVLGPSLKEESISLTIGLLFESIKLSFLLSSEHCRLDQRFDATDRELEYCLGFGKFPPKLFKAFLLVL